jgi:hypothetical protein
VALFQCRLDVGRVRNVSSRVVILNSHGRSPKKSGCRIWGGFGKMASPTFRLCFPAGLLMLGLILLQVRRREGAAGKRMLNLAEVLASVVLIRLSA